MPDQNKHIDAGFQSFQSREIVIEGLDMQFLGVHLLPAHHEEKAGHISPVLIG